MNETMPPQADPVWSAAAAEVFRAVTRDYDLATHEVESLRRACCQLDHAVRAAEQINVDGVTVRDKFGQLREHPCLATERQCLHCFRLLMRELRLDFNDDPAERLRLKA